MRHSFWPVLMGLQQANQCKRHFLAALILFLMLPHSIRAENHMDTVGRWGVYEINLKASQRGIGPYGEIIADADTASRYLTATFRCLTGDAKTHTLTVKGFWDGGQHWKVRFSPPDAGQWEYSTHSKDKGLNAKKGRFMVEDWTEAELAANPLRRGLIYVAAGGRHFKYADGTPFIWIGDTWWAWADKRIRLETFETLADNRSQKGFTVGQMVIRMGDFIGKTREPDFEFMHHAESFIRYANEKGIVVSVSGMWGGKVTPEIGKESRIWWKYLISRLSAYNVVWMVSSEYNMNNYGGAGLDYWKALGRLVKNEDPYRRITSLHPTPPSWSGGNQGNSRQWSTADVLNQESWLDFNQSQVGHGKFRNEMAPQVAHDAYGKQPAKPIVISEPWYEFIPGYASAMDIRLAFWGSFLSGAAGITYGGGHVWWAYLPDNHEKPDKSMGAYPIDPDLKANTLDYPGAQSVGFMAHYLAGIPWWELEPHPEFVIDYPAQFCKAVPGKEYLVYLRYGGNFRLDLRATGHKMVSYTWTDLVTLKTRTGETQGGGLVQLSSGNDFPGSLDYHDFILHVKVKE